jgi:predicted DCC family thiol-disulfide oxidoreductase YuxK
MDSIILYEPGTAYYYKSEAALKIAAKLDSFYSMLVVFKILPTAFSDFIYDWIARNRYRWFGRKDNCMIPTPELKSKFLECIICLFSVYCVKLNLDFSFIILFPVITVH